MKGKVHANVAEMESSSNEELEKSFTAHVNISDEGKITKASMADFSAYSWIIDSSATTHICVQLEAFTMYQSIP